MQREEGKKEYGLLPDLRVDLSAEETAALIRSWASPSAPAVRDHPLEEATELLRAKLGNRPSTASSRVLPARRAGS